ncbi:hypothetical protein [uncultured Roseibium sp.]|uniref:hypothetical protein n=1 Tax=uncultured Roseibium sp. TaxID=1936171 RepID=UPI00261EEE76|nr:hypothetical protein [uncultured Roseibium sp.]
MRSSTLSASDQLSIALDAVKKAEDALKLTAEQSPNWLVMEAKMRCKEARSKVEIAGGHVAELLQIEDE